MAAEHVRAVLAVLAAASLATTACSMPRRVDAPVEPSSRTGLGAADREVYGQLIRSMLDQGQYYAALAHVQQQQRGAGGDREELRYLEAEARRSLGQVEAADALYQSLLRGRYAAQAYHGLGLLYARTELGKAIGYLREASRRDPTSAEVRNDLGYALLRAGRYADALPELATALELAPDSDKARNNLLLLLILQRDEAAVRRLARDTAVPPETLGRLRQQAADMRVPQGTTGGG